MNFGGQVHVQRHVALRPGSSMQFRCAASIRYEQHDPTSMEVELLYLGDDEERAEMYRSTRAIDRDLLILHALDNGSDSINLIGLIRWMGDTSKLKLDVSAIEIGIDRQPVDYPVKASFSVALQPSGILIEPALHRRHGSGDIDVKRLEEGQIIVESSVGPIEAMEAYDYLEGSAFGDQVTHQVQRAKLTGNFQLCAGQSLRSIHEVLLDEVDAICKTLSLCYRQPVSAYEIAYLCEYADQPSYTRCVYRRKWHSPRTKEKEEELVHTSNLREGGLSLLVSSLKSHAESEALVRGVGFLSASYVSFIETAYFMAFSAMETVVNAMSEDKAQSLVSPSKWKKVQSRFKDVLAQIILEGVVSKEVADRMLEKLPELRRATLISSVMQVAQAYSVRTNDLWTQQGFEEGLRHASSLRNELFHAASTADSGLMAANTVRIRTLTERLLVAALSWPAERLWVWRDERLRRIIQPRAPDDHGDEGTKTGV